MKHEIASPFGSRYLLVILCQIGFYTILLFGARLNVPSAADIHFTRYASARVRSRALAYVKVWT